MYWTLSEASTTEEYVAAIELFNEYVLSLDFDLSFQNVDEELTILPVMYGPPSGRLYLVESDGIYVGCAGLRRIENETTCELKRMSIKPTHRQLGIARAIMELAIQTARELGYKTMKLDTIGYKMPVAVKLYTSFGFRETTPYNFNPHNGVLYFERKL
jgi:putative acetyltransferase